MGENNVQVHEKVKFNHDDYIVLFIHITGTLGFFLLLYIFTYDKSDLGGAIFKFIITVTSILSAVGYIAYYFLFWRFIINRALVLKKFKSEFNLISPVIFYLNFHLLIILTLYLNTFG